MIIAKFGGSSVRNAERMRDCVRIIKLNPNINGVVVSATYNTTNELELMGKLAVGQKRSDAQIVLRSNQVRHQQLYQELFPNDQEEKKLCWQRQEELYQELSSYLDQVYARKNKESDLLASIYAIGERLSSNLFYQLLVNEFPEKKLLLIDARELILTDENFVQANPNIELIKKQAKIHQNQVNEENTLFLTQGFIGRSLSGKTTVLGREGSDYTATLLGEAFGATLVQIWTDVAGVFPVDPRIDNQFCAYPRIGQEQAALMATQGAKVLFPDTLAPAIRSGFEVFVGKTQEPEKGGTLIVAQKNCPWSLALVVKDQKAGEDLKYALIGDQASLEKFLTHCPEIQLNDLKKKSNHIEFSTTIPKTSEILALIKKL